MKRRHFINSLVAGAAALVTRPLAAFNEARVSTRYLRPPGALAEDEFVARCIHCGQCGEACPNRCIRYFGLENGASSLDTPYITPRDQACILCMKCGDICPTGAITPIAGLMQPILDNVHMGHAVVDHSLCLSWQGQSCGVCYRACPLQNIAIRVGWMEQPEVLDQCVGCGLCERACIQMPQAIRIIPDYEHRRATARATENTT